MKEKECNVVTLENGIEYTEIDRINDDNKTYDIAVLDMQNLVANTLINDLSGDKKYTISQIEKNDYTASTIPNNMMIIEISGDTEEGIKASIISKEGINIKFYNPIKEELNKIRNQILAKKHAINDDVLKTVQKDVSINRVMLGVAAEDSTTKEMVKLFSSAITYMITVFIFSKMANEIASEKQSKATEYILTTVSAKEYLFAKIVSNIAWLLLQGLFMLVYYYMAVQLHTIGKVTNIDISSFSFSSISNISKDMIIYILTLIVYNVLNVILLCIIQAAMASKTSSTSEAGNSVSLLLLIMMASYISTVAFLSPYETVSGWLYVISCLPILSAYFVPAMMVIGQATALQIVVSLFLLIVAIPVAFKYCASIFKDGILDYTKTKKKKGVEKSAEQLQTELMAKREMKHFGFVVGVAIIIYVGVQTILTLLGGITLKALLGKWLTETDLTMILQILLQVTSLGLASAFVLSYTNETKDTLTKRKMSIKAKMQIILVVLFLVFALQIVLSTLLYPAIGLDYDTTDLFKVNANSKFISKIILIITLSVTPAIFEELFFRKAIIHFSIRYGKVFALLFSALFFGMLHMNLSQGLFAFIMGLMFGAIYLYTGDIKISMLIHFLNNCFAALELILPEIIGIALIAALIVTLLVGFLILIVFLRKKENREKILQFCRIKINTKKIKEKYWYIFYDYAFDVSLLLIVLTGIMTEKMLR